MKTLSSNRNLAVHNKVTWMYKLKVKFLVIFILSFTNTNCNKKDQPATPNVNLSLATLVVLAHTPDQKSCVALIELATRMVGNTKEAQIKGKVLRFTSNSLSEITQVSKSTYYDVISQNESIFKFKSMADVLESRFKTITTYSRTSVLTQEQILSMLKGSTIDVASITKPQKRRTIEDVIISFFVPSAYAQTVPGGDINKIIPELVDSIYNLVSDCATPSYVEIGIARDIVAQANENFIRSNYSCISAIIDLAKKTKNLWDYVAYNVGQAMQPNNSYTASSLTNDLKNGSNSSSTTNTQSVSPSSVGGSFGDPHLTTMDGFHYDFQGYGEFIVVKSLTDNFEIQVRQEEINPYRSGKVTMNTAVAINTGSDVICIFPKELYINKQARSFQLSGQRDFGISQGSLTLSDNFITVQTPNNDVIRINVQNLEQGFLDYRISLNENRKGKVKGLLGNFDGDRSNEVQTQDGKIINPYVFGDTYPTYTDSWRISSTASLFVYPNGSSTATYTKKEFPKSQTEIDAAVRLHAETVCRQQGITEEPYFSACVMDVSFAGSDRYAISAIGAEETKLLINNFEINNFTSFEELDLTQHGNEEIVDGKLYMTHSKLWQSAAVYKKYKVDISKGFETTFDFSMTDVGGISDARNRVGADGIVFIIQDYGSKIVPPAGGIGIGYDGLPRSVAVEFDTYDNGPQENKDDISLNTQGLNPNSVNDRNTLIKAQTRPLPIMNDGKIHNVVIRYTKRADGIYKMEVFFDKDSTPCLTADNINIQKTIGAYSTGVYIGLTSATGWSYENHIIHKWSFKPLQ